MDRGSEKDLERSANAAPAFTAPLFLHWNSPDRLRHWSNVTQLISEALAEAPAILLSRSSNKILQLMKQINAGVFWLKQQKSPPLQPLYSTPLETNCPIPGAASLINQCGNTMVGPKERSLGKYHFIPKWPVFCSGLLLKPIFFLSWFIRHDEGSRRKTNAVWCHVHVESKEVKLREI